MVETTFDAERKLWAVNNPDTPEGRAFWAVQRVEALTREKEQLERRNEEIERRSDALEKRLSSLEHFADKFSKVDTATVTWLTKADEDKLKKVDSAIKLLENLHFMGRWTWIGIGTVVAAITATAGAISWLKANVPFQR